MIDKSMEQVDSVKVAKKMAATSAVKNAFYIIRPKMLMTITMR